MVGDWVIVASGAVKALVYFKNSLLATGTLTKTVMGILDELIDVLSVHVGSEFFSRNSFIFAFKKNKHRFCHLVERSEALG